jgi:hypothetical protein
MTTVNHKRIGNIIIWSNVQSLKTSACLAGTQLGALILKKHVKWVFIFNANYKKKRKLQ